MLKKDWNEKKTRKEFIDKLLTGSKWDPIVQFKASKEYKHGSVEEYPTQVGPADYILFHKGRALAGPLYPALQQEDRRRQVRFHL